mgnify:CR=1 FL=1
MKLYIRQKVFSWNDKFEVYDQWGKTVFNVEGKLLSIGKKLYVFDTNGNEAAYIEQKVLSFLPRYFIYTNGVRRAEIVKNFTLFRQKYTVAGPGWDVRGDFTAHEYEITENGAPVVRISKKWLTFGDCYELDVPNENNLILALCVVLAIDCATETDNNNTLTL